MISRVKDMEAAGRLFAGWQESLIWSCLQEVMGAVYADYEQHPRSAMAVLGDFCFFAGRPDRELVRYKPDGCRQDFIIMVPQSPAWADLIADVYADSAKAVTRYAIKKEEHVFDKDKLREAAGSLPPGCRMELMDEKSYHLCRAGGWSADLVSQFSDYEMYRELGIGAVVYQDGMLVAGASSYARYRKGIEIEIDTKEDCRRMGLAFACGAKLILECLERGLYPSWDAQNKASVALAEKLGYHFSHAYPAYEIWGY